MEEQAEMHSEELCQLKLYLQMLRENNNDCTSIMNNLLEVSSSDQLVHILNRYTHVALAR